MTEEWRPVPGYEGYYEVSDLGRVRGLDRYVPVPTGRRFQRGGVLVPAVDGANRRSVRLCLDGVQATRRVYTLVLEAFVGPRPPKMAACHADGDSLNDRLSNLRWGTWSSNTKDTIRHGRHNHATTTHCPRGHELSLANVQPSMYRRTGSRACLACHRAASNYRSALKRGLEADFEQLADMQYRRITSATT
jgi:hypothetical protein